MKTGAAVTELGIYQSACGCRTAMTLPVGNHLPRCLGCDELVEWTLVQAIRPSKPPPAAPPGTEVSRSRPPRPRLDSAIGETDPAHRRT